MLVTTTAARSRERESSDRGSSNGTLSFKVGADTDASSIRCARSSIICNRCSSISNGSGDRIVVVAV